MKMITVVGARPQFVKAAAVSRELGNHPDIHEVIVHTGQHYDANMSDIFFKELDIPTPDYFLGIGSGSHGKQTGEMLAAIEEVLMKEKPDLVLVYGDTNSTLAGALAASKIHIPVVHVEAGLRSYNMRMPEEQNRVLTDHISSLLLCPTQNAVENLAREGIQKGVHNVGDVMYDSVLYSLGIAEKKIKFEKILNSFETFLESITSNIKEDSLTPNGYYLATIHRAENTDSADKIQTILDAFSELDLPVVFPVHPRTQGLVARTVEKAHLSNIYFIKPVGYLEMLILLKNSAKVITDSGGVQKEAYFLDRPCVTLREQTEWVETLKGNWNVLCPLDKDQIISKVTTTRIEREVKADSYFGDGKAAQKIAALLKQMI